MDKTREIQQLITEERKRQGITYRKFAEMIGTDARRLVAWKNGESGISLSLADKALKVLRLSVTIGCDRKNDK